MNRNSLPKCHRVLFIMALIFTLSILPIGCGGGGEGGDDTPEAETTPEAEATIGPEGGIVEVTDTNSPLFGIRIEIPPEALMSDTNITIIKPAIEPPSPFGHDMGNTTFQLGPSNLSFSKPVKLIVPKAEASDYGQYYSYNSDEDGWELLGTKVEDDNFEITVYHFSFLNTLCHFTDFFKCVGFEPCSTITYKIDANTTNVTTISESQIIDSIRNSIKTWQTTLGSKLTFVETTSPTADIVFLWKAKDWIFLTDFGDIDTIARCYIKNNGQFEVRFRDTNEIEWVNTSSSATGVNLEAISLHETGHLLGLPHICDQANDDKCYSCLDGPVMAPNYFVGYPPCLNLQDSDINRINALYPNNCDNAVGLIAYYPFNGNADDESGNENNGVENGGVGYGTGIEGQGAVFDGFNDYISATDADSLDGMEKMTVSFWIKPSENLNSSSGRQDFLYKPYHSPTSGSSWSVTYGDGTGKLSFNVVRDTWVPGSGGPHTWLSVETQFQGNQWYHLACVYEGPFQASAYINGILQDGTVTGIAGGNVSMDTDQPLNIGRAPYNNYYFNGIMDEIRIYNRVLSESEIQELYSN